MTAYVEHIYRGDKYEFRKLIMERKMDELKYTRPLKIEKIRHNFIQSSVRFGLCRIPGTPVEETFLDTKTNYSYF